MRSTDNARRDRLDERSFRLGAGFKQQEREQVLEELAVLGSHLARWDPSEVEVDVSVRERGGKEQRVTLRAFLPGRPPLVAVGYDRDLMRALAEAKRDLITQIDRHKTERQPKSNRQLRRDTIRHPGSNAGGVVSKHSRAATLTPDELALLEAELEGLKRRRERVAADLDTIRDTVGDLVDADAADQIGLADELTAIDDRIAELNWHLHGGRPESEVPGALPDGTEVTLRFPDGELVHLRVVAIAGEVPVVDEHTLAPDSPMGLALAGHRPGDVVTFETPQGPQQVELVAVRYPD